MKLNPGQPDSRSPLSRHSFSHLGREDCSGRKCYRLDITPLRKDKYLIKGQIWIDAEDWSIVRVQGLPTKRPSFWARQTVIDHRYKRIDGIWLDDSMESTSDILIAGRSTLKIQYSYESIQTDADEALNGKVNGPVIRAAIADEPLSNE